MIELIGKPAVPGIGIGKARFLIKSYSSLTRQKIVKGQELEQRKRLESAIKRTEAELIEIKEEIEEKLGKEHALIIESHLMLLQDKSLMEEVVNRIEKELETAENAIESLIEKYHEIFKNVNDYHMRGKVHDIEDVLRRLQKNLNYPGEKEEWEGGVIIARNILPSEAAFIITKRNPEGLITELGGETYHAVILARAFGVPMVVGIEEIEDRIREGENVIVDGNQGKVILSPASYQIVNYRKIKAREERERKLLLKAMEEENKTLDGHPFRLFVNIEFPSEVEKIPKDRVNGIGLFRTEYLLLSSGKVPDEEEQVKFYSYISEGFKDITIRLFDLGAEKEIEGLPFQEEENPALGERGIRYLFSHKELLYTQLRAILIASAIHPGIRIMAPMITNVLEVKKLFLVLEDVKETLRMEGKHFREDIELGIMVEVPSIAIFIDRILRYVDFVSIGTNDLSQYVFATDRTNERVSYLCEPLEPAFLRMLSFIIKESKKRGKRVSICGEMASNPLHAAVLLGLGLEEFSSNPAMLPRVKKALISLEKDVVKRKVINSLRFSTGHEVEEYLLGEMEKIYPEVYRCVRRLYYEKNG